MDRRKFILNSGAFLSVPFLFGGQALRAMGSPLVAPSLLAGSKKLILIQLDGGNDGLNMVFPTDQYDKLAAVRPEIIIPQNKILALTDKTGIHPAMTEMKQMWDQGKIMVIQNVGYPKPNLSHFRSKEIILSASESSEVISSGWFGRYLSQLHPTYPDKYPNTNFPHPLTISISNVSSPAFQGIGTNMGIAVQNLTTSYTSPTGGTTFPSTPYGKELKFVATMMQSTEKYLQSIIQAGNASQNLSTLYPAAGKNRLADQLKIVARLICGGLSTPVYSVSLGGFDLHANAVVTSDKTTGAHATLLKYISEAINAFQDDLKLHKQEDEVIGFVYTEFGRRIRSNTSIGTDHGEAFPMILFGSLINPVVYGANPVIDTGISTSANVPWKVDFRSVYASVFKYWYGVSATGVRDVLNKDFEYIPILKSSVDAPEQVVLNDLKLVSIYPNPVTDHATVQLATPGGNISLQMFSAEGRLVRSLVEKELPRGVHTLTVSRDGLPGGTYFLVLQNNSSRISKQLFFH